MADDNTQDAQATGGEAAVGGEAGTDLAAQVTHWKQMARKNEARAKENAEKAKKFDELEEASKSELQKALEAQQAAEARAAAAEVAALRGKVAAAKGVPLELLTGATEEEITAAADALLAWRTPAGGDGQQGKPPAASAAAGVAGAQGEPIHGVEQLTQDDLKKMTAAEINKARREGRLDRLMGKTPTQ
ncbi:hypothetical protein [Actinobaculum sp. 352]|uniref:hypothetical protein n=1 Tax=Actinobaculum sp. 352 TaxID=2490946 RepID=UPI000F7EE98F|nr:hypothetical protein [Actinobaculum sp. 352]RTE50396.1 hypothetical protein EKN07_04150 [Actinobaculum sp. 352]